MSVRKNTLVIDFSVLPKRPDAEQVQQFLEKKVKLNLADTTTIQFHNIRNVVYVETIDNETAYRYEKANHYKHTITVNNKEFKIPVYVDSEAVTVRVHDLPTHIPHLTVTDAMGQYGVVISIARERWKHHFPGFFNGVRVLRIRLNRSIPSRIVISGEETLVTYRGQLKTCHHCGNAAHPKQKCAKPSITLTNTNTPQPPPPGGKPGVSSSGPERNEEDFPSLSPVSNAKTQQNKTNSANNTTGGNGDDCDDDDENDGEDNGGGGGSDDDGVSGDDVNGSSDESDFFEATTRKRRMTKGQANEIKKKCVTKGNQNIDVVNNNRFQALEELDPTYPSEVEMEELSNRLKNKQQL